MSGVTHADRLYFTAGNFMVAICGWKSEKGGIEEAQPREEKRGWGIPVSKGIRGHDHRRQENTLVTALPIVLTGQISLEVRPSPRLEQT